MFQHLLFCGLFICNGLFAADVFQSLVEAAQNQTNEQKIVELFVIEAKRLITEKSTKEAEVKWAKNLTARIKQKVEDSPIMNDQSALNTIVIDYFSSKSNKDFEKAELRLEISRYIAYYVDFSFVLPQKAKEFITIQNYDKYVLQKLVVQEKAEEVNTEKQ